MSGVSYALADFVTGGPILDLPVRKGATWAAQLNRPDVLSCTVNMRDPDALALDLRAASSPRKTVMLARTDDDVILAWGLIDDDREWDEDAQTVTLSARGIWGSWLGNSIIGPPAALTAPLILEDGLPNPALDTTLSGISLGTMGKRLVQDRVSWPGSPSIIFQADDLADRENEYLFPAMKRIGAALTDLTNRVNGPDFAFYAERGGDGLHLVYRMEFGTETEPRIGQQVGTWSLGGDTSITHLKVTDSATDISTAAWGQAGRANGTALLSRVLNSEMIDTDGYPPLDYVDSTRQSVVLQETLDSYTQAAADYARREVRSLSFSVRSDVSPLLGSYRPGDTVTLDVPKPDPLTGQGGHPWLTGDILIRITSMKGDETGKTVAIGCEVIG